VIGQTKERNTIKSCVIKAKWENARYYLHIWPICYVYDIYYILINEYNIQYYGYGNFY
jgi:hypothetical protein